MLLDTEAHETPARERTKASPAPLDLCSPALLVSRVPERRRRTPLRYRRRSPLLLMVAGLAVVSVAALVLLQSVASVSGEAGTGIPEPVPALLAGVTIGGPTDVAAQMTSYAPGQSSGWHSHTGLHAVVVLSGTLTIVDGECRRHAYGPGDSYVGGREVHVALNESTSALDLAVTYMFPAGVSHTGFHLPAAAPPNCEIR